MYSISKDDDKEKYGGGCKANGGLSVGEERRKGWDAKIFPPFVFYISTRVNVSSLVP
jgi:hypothetical protein